MRVKLKPETTMCGPDGNHFGGSEVEVSDDVGKQLCDSGKADPVREVEAENADSKQEPEKAVTTAPPTPPTMKEIVAAYRQVDLSVKDNTMADGVTPTVGAVEAILGKDITKDQRDEAAKIIGRTEVK